MAKIAALIMVKDEQARISETIKSLTEFDGIIIYDTGSTDSTLEIIKTTSTSMNVPVHIKIGTFVDFATSRNEALTFADDCCKEHEYTHLVLLDANDQIVGFVKDSLVDKTNAAYFVRQELKYSDGGTLSFFNIKVLKALSGVRFVGRVHEYLDDCRDTAKLEGFYIFQDRTLDDDKSKVRWERDRLMLEQDYSVDPHNTRTLFYLAQTYECLGDHQLAYDYYEKRTTYVNGFEEERWWAILKCGQLSECLKADTAEVWYLKALSHTVRAEPLVALAKIYASRNNYVLAYTFADLACKLPYPKNDLLFVEQRVYTYERWHVTGIVAWHAAKLLETASVEILSSGKLACGNAIAAGNNVELDTKNLTWYTDEEIKED